MRSTREHRPVAGAEKRSEQTASRTLSAKNAPTFSKIQTRKTFEGVCEQIQQKVAAGDLRPGDRLPAEAEMAVQFRVSRSVMKEALRKLEVAGVVAAGGRSAGSYFISEGAPTALVDAIGDMLSRGHVSSRSLLEARLLITNDVLRLACERAKASDLNALEEDIDRVEALTEAGELKERAQNISTFYRLLAQATGNEVLVMLVDSLTGIVRAQLDRIGPPPRPGLIVVRRRILAAMREGRTEDAVLEMTRHLKALHRYIEKSERAHGSQQDEMTT